MIVVARPGQTLLAFDPDGTDRRPLHPDSSGATAPRWSPEGNRIAAILNGNLVVLLATGQLLHTLTSTGGVVAEPSWSPDGTRIAYVRSNGELRIADARRPGEDSLLLAGPVVSAAWSPFPDADQIAYTDGGPILTVRPDGSEAGTELEAADPRGTRSELAWNPSPIVATSLVYTLTVAAGGTTWVEGSGFGIGDGNANGEDRAPAWSPDGLRLFFTRAGVASVYTPPSTRNGITTFAFVSPLRVNGTSGGWQPSIVSSTAAYEGDVSTGALAQMFFRVQPPAGILPVTAVYATVAGSATDAVNADFVPASGSVTTPTPFGRPETIAVSIVGDTDLEQDEVFYVDFRFPSDPSAPLRVRGTILNDDGGRNGLITYASNPAGMALDPGNRRIEQLLPGAADSVSPVYSPSGARVAYATVALPGGYSVVVADRDGNVQKQFNSAGALPGSLVWSPDGERLAWIEQSTLYVADPTSANPILTIPDVFRASWSNDTAFPRRLAYERPGAGPLLFREVWTVREDGSGATWLASDAALGEWSPDGSTISFDLGGGGIWFINANGTNRRLVVSDGELFRWSPLASPYGGHLFVVKRADGRFVVRGEAGPETLLPVLPGVVTDIQWSPDGNQLVASIVDAVTGDVQLWIIGPDDSGTPFSRVEQVTARATSTSDTADAPRWSTTPYRPTVTLEGGAGFEGLQARAPLFLGAPASQPITVGFRWYDGTALVGQDYVAPAVNTVTFEPGQTEEPIVWSLLQDNLLEGDETFGVELTTSSAARIGTPSTALVRIVDVPPQTPLQVSISDASVAEGHGAPGLLTFTVTLTGTPSGPVDVQVATSDGTATLADLDYQATSGSVTLSTASPSVTFNVLVTGDKRVEPDESVLVALSNPSGGAAIADGQGVGTIVNDDTTPVLNPIGDLGARPELMPIPFTASATDADGDAVTYSLIGNPPANSAIGATSGVFDWIPSEDQGPGAYGFSVRASDGFGNFSDQPVSVTVMEVNTAPALTVTGVPATPVNPGTFVALSASAIDSDLPANTVSFTLTGAPAGATIGLTSGAFTWTPSAAQAGSHTFEVIATDDGVPPLSASQTVTIVVNAPPPPGGDESVSRTFGGAGGTLTTDTEGDGATPADPIETDVTTPSAGAVSIVEPAPGAVPPPTAWNFLGYLARITAPVASVANPLRLRFVLDASIAGPAGGAAAIAVFRNGVEVGPCTGAPQAVPDPCVASRQNLADGDAELVILTSQASEWQFGTARVTRGLAFALARPVTGGAVSLSAYSSNGQALGFLVYFNGSEAFQSARLTAFAVEAGGRSAWIAGVGRCGRRFLAYVDDNGTHDDRVRLWIDGVAKTGDGALRGGVVLVRP